MLHGYRWGRVCQASPQPSKARTPIAQDVDCGNSTRILHRHYTCKGLLTIFHWRGANTEGPKVESGGGVLDWGALLGGSGGALWAPPAGLWADRAPTAQRLSTIFSTQDGLSWHYNTVTWGLWCSHWGEGDPRGSSLRTPPYTWSLSCISTCKPLLRRHQPWPESRLDTTVEAPAAYPQSNTTTNQQPTDTYYRKDAI